MMLGLALSMCVPRGGLPAPALTSLNYDQADPAGGEAITITGTGLAAATSVLVGVTSATITANTATSLTFTMPAKTAGTYNVTVTTAVGTSNALTIEAWSFSSLSLSISVGSDFSASPWVGRASAGASGTRDLAEATNPPATAAAVNGKIGADFDGTNDQLLNATNLATLLGAGNFSVSWLFNADDSGSATTGFKSMASSDGSSRMQMGLYQGGGTPAVFFRFLSIAGGSVFFECTKACSVGAVHLAQAWWDGTNLNLTVDQTSATPTAGNTPSFSGTLAVGKSGTNFYNGKLYELLMSASDLGATARTKIRKACIVKYGLNL